MNKQDINLVNTRTWVLCNDGTNPHGYRKLFIKEHGGRFIRNERQQWLWKDVQEKEEPKAIYVVVEPNGNEIIPENFQGYCRENNLNKSALYGVAKGDRKHHKNYTCYRKEV
tara:strand:- start:1638 stop:1973 length:336 start_codon:yes stop_codon:yes gene_type:complete